MSLFHEMYRSEEVSTQFISSRYAGYLTSIMNNWVNVLTDRKKALVINKCSHVVWSGHGVWSNHQFNPHLSEQIQPPLLLLDYKHKHKFV